MAKILTFSAVNLFTKTSKEVVRVQTMFKGLTGIIVASTWFVVDAKSSLYIAISGFVMDIFLCCFKVQNSKVQNHEKISSQSVVKKIS